MSACTLLRCAWLCHAVLLVAVVSGTLSVSGGAGVRAALTVAGAAPLLLAVPGLLRGKRYTFQWLALALVVYSGFAMVEVVVSLGRSLPAAVVLLAALMELALLYSLNRLPSPRPPGTRE